MAPTHPIVAACAVSAGLLVVAAAGTLAATLDAGIPAARRQRSVVAASVLVVLAICACCAVCVVGIRRDPGNPGRRRLDVGGPPAFEQRALTAI